MKKEIEEIRNRDRQNYPGAERDIQMRVDVTTLLTHIAELEDSNKDLRFKLSCHASDCIADYEDLEKRLEQLEASKRRLIEGINKIISKLSGDFRTHLGNVGNDYSLGRLRKDLYAIAAEENDTNSEEGHCFQPNKNYGY